MRRESHVRFYESGGVRFPSATRPNIYVGSKRAAHRVMAGVSQFIESRLRLKVNTAKSAVAKPQDRHFLGFSLRKTESDVVEVLLSKRSMSRIDEKIRELIPRNWGQGLESCIKRLNRYLLGWIGFFGIVSPSEEYMLERRDAHVRRRLRALQIRQWGKRRHIARHLQRLGATKRASCGTVYNGRPSTWALSGHPVVHKTLRNVYFTARGLVSVVEKWLSRARQKSSAPAQLTLTLE